jgi:hypothetical protein
VKKFEVVNSTRAPVAAAAIRFCVLTGSVEKILVVEVRAEMFSPAAHPDRTHSQSRQSDQNRQSRKVSKLAEITAGVGQLDRVDLLTERIIEWIMVPPFLNSIKSDRVKNHSRAKRCVRVSGPVCITVVI